MTTGAAAYHLSCQHEAYRLSCDQFDELWAYAGGNCQICGVPEAETARQRLVIDHAHDYGYFAVRGLLCDSCNRYMDKVDNGKIMAPPVEFYEYRYNAWFLRMAQPKLFPRKRVVREAIERYVGKS